MTLKRLTAFSLLLMLFLPACPIALKAQQTYNGVSDVSWGRFATWPNIRFDVEHYEGDVLKRVYADRIQRTHKNLSLNWQLYFGATSYYNSIEDIPHFDDVPFDQTNIWPEDQNWVYKKFAVLRENASYGSLPKYGGTSSAPNYPDQDYTYTVSVNSVSPGTRIITEHSMFYLENDNDNSDNYHLGYAACHYKYTGYDGFMVKGDFSKFTDPDDNKKFTGEFIAENWMLFFDPDTDAKYGAHIPVMVSFSHRPGEVKCYRDSVEFHYWGSDRDIEKTFFISLPFGAKAFPPDTTASWAANGLPQYVIDQCRLVNRLVNNWPVAVDEDFYFTASSDASPDSVTIRNTFSYSYMGQNWDTSGYVSQTPVGFLPPLVALAADEGVISSGGLPTGTSDIGLGFPTKYGPLKIVNGVSLVEYTIPGAPEHDIHLVGTPNDFETIWKQRVNRMINREATSNDRYRASVGVWGAMGNRGEIASLALTRDYTREHYIDFMSQTVHKRVFSEDGSARYADGTQGWGYWDWTGVVPPPSGSWPGFWSGLWSNPSSSNIEQPWDFNASSGMILEFLYEYGLWSGDWTVLDENWSFEGWTTDTIGVEQIMDPMKFFHDWGYMASSYCLFGGAGGIMDMFPAELAGYQSYAKMADILGYADSAATGWYLAAKSQIPFVTRWAAKDYIGQYYAVTDSMPSPAGDYIEVIDGFGEWEPSGPMHGENEYGTSVLRTLEEWADWTISGERIHPLTFDILSALVDDDNSFEAYLDDFQDQSAYCLDLRRGTFFEDKLYCFYKWKKYTDEDGLAVDINYLYASEDGDINGAAQAYTSYDLNWYNNIVYDNSGSTPPVEKKGRPFVLMPALVETYGVPVRIGSWAPAKLDSAYYDTETSTFTAYLTEGDGFSQEVPVVRLQADQNPSVSFTQGSGSSEWDSVWKVEKVTLTGDGPWIITASIPPYPGVIWAEDQAEHNLIMDPGFEDCGAMPNIEMGWLAYAGNEGTTRSTYQNCNTGWRSARLKLTDPDDAPYLWQKVWVKPPDAQTPDRIPIDVDFWYDIASDDVELRFRVMEFTNNVNRGQTAYKILYSQNLTTDDPSEGWQHLEVPAGMLSVGKDSAVVQCYFSVVQRDTLWTSGADHWVDIDDVTMTCDLLDTGVDNEPDPPPDPGGGSGGKDEPVIGGPLPLLSQFEIRPNPFNPVTVISFELGRRARVDLKLYDPEGRLINTLADGFMPAGTARFTWNGTNERGGAISSGIYFYRLQVEDIVKTGKLMLLR